MHFALPPRKTSNPPPYARAAASRSSTHRGRKLVEFSGYAVLAILTIYLIFHYGFSSRSESFSDDETTLSVPAKILIVTVVDEERMSSSYIQKIKANREDYASRHGRHFLSTIHGYYYIPFSRRASRPNKLLLRSRLHQLLHLRFNI